MSGGGGERIRWGFGSENWFIGDDMEEGFGGHNSAHRVADKDGTDAGVYGWGGSAGGDFEVDNNVLQPAMEMSVLAGE